MSGEENLEVEDSLRVLVSDFKKVLDDHEELLKCFCRKGVQLEGWLKGELLYFFEKEKKKVILDFDREVTIPIGRKVDFRITVGERTNFVDVWIEIKYWLIGYQKGSYYNANFYFGDSSSVGIRPDIEKLLEIQKDPKFMLILAVANPGSDEWEEGVKKFNRKFKPLHISSLTNPKDFAKTFFLGLLRITSD
jgi:hypothetical protein